MRIRYRISDRAVKWMFVETGESRQTHELSFDWLELDLEDRELLVELYGLQNTFNVSSVWRWCGEDSKIYTDYTYEYDVVYDSVEELMDTARVVLTQARDSARLAQSRWAEKQIDLVQEMIASVNRWHSAAQKLRPEDKYDEYAYRLDTLEIISKHVPDGVRGVTGKNLSVELNCLVGEYQRLVDTVRAEYVKLHETWVIGAEVAAQIAYANERNCWVGAYGSEYLRNLADEGYAFDDQYVRERLNAEYPGWFIWEGQRDDTVPTAEQVTIAKAHGARVFEDYKGHKVMTIEGYLGNRTIAKWL